MLMQSRGPQWWGVQSSPCRPRRMSSDWTRTEKMSGVVAAVETPPGCVPNKMWVIYSLEGSFGAADDAECGGRSSSLLPMWVCSCSSKKDGALGRYLKKMRPSQLEMAHALWSLPCQLGEGLERRCSVDGLDLK